MASPAKRLIPRFESGLRVHFFWSYRLSVRIAPCHGAETGSIPVGTANTAKENPMGKLIVGHFMDDFGQSVYPYTLESYRHRHEFFANDWAFYQSSGE